MRSTIHDPDEASEVIGASQKKVPGDFRFDL
jgi:hypothetical protein